MNKRLLTVLVVLTGLFLMPASTYGRFVGAINYSVFLVIKQ